MHMKSFNMNFLLIPIYFCLMLFFSSAIHDPDKDVNDHSCELETESDDPVCYRKREHKQTTEQIDCHPEKHPDEVTCVKRGCTWQRRNKHPVPPCVYSENHGYLVEGEIRESHNGLTADITRIATPQIYAGDIYNHLTVTIEYQTESRLRIKIEPKGVKRYEVPDEALNIQSPDTAPNSNKLYKVSLVRGPPRFGVTVRRKHDSKIVFSTDLPGFTFSDQFIQITTRLPSDNLYGFGEHNHRQFRHDMNWKTWPIFARSILAVGPENLYGAHPVYMNLENSGNATMVLLKNSNAMEVSLQPYPNPAITYRVIGGLLDFYIFMGPSPEQAVKQYLEAIGRPVMPPYWALGYHICRWGYKNVDDMKMVIDRNRAAGIPYDGQWADIEYMYKLFDYTYDRTDWNHLPIVVQDLHDKHQKFVVIIDPGVGANVTIVEESKMNSPGYNMFNDGIQRDVFIKNGSNQVLLGKVWPGLTAFPDFTNPKTEDWWLRWMMFLYNNETIKFDALWIDMNEPASFVHGSTEGCTNNIWDYPPYVPNIAGSEVNGRMHEKTICMDSMQHWGRHYDVHSLYGHSEAIQTYNAMLKITPGLRPWTMTRSSFVGTGKYATKWMGDNESKWPNLHWSIVSIMEFSMFGFAMNGADICGFWYEAEYEMCLRWQQLGAFYPFSRNHNGRQKLHFFRNQDPGAWDQRFIDIVKPVLLTRYRLLPYLYTLMYQAHEQGLMVMKALLFEFPEDKNTWSIDRQFLLGPALLLSPVLEQNQTIVEAYFPSNRWYNYYTGNEVLPVGTKHQLYTPLEKYNLHIRGGHVIPVQKPSATTYESRRNPLGIIIALDINSLANGELFLDDGESLETYKNNQSTIIEFRMVRAGELIIKPKINYYKETDNLQIETIEIYGLDKIPEDVFINGKPVDCRNIRQSGMIIQIFGPGIQLVNSTVVTWAVY